MDVSREFRFSPRPNRAAEIKWRPWGEPAFAEARRLGRPVLLSLSAVWCHWCHVMDETSYSDPRVIAAVNEHFVPIRVDNDRHPDVNRRYNMGGWPTTAFLAPSGDVLTGGTYLPPEQMLESLARVKAFFDANKAQIAALEGECATDGDGSAARAPHRRAPDARARAGGPGGRPGRARRHLRGGRRRDRPRLRPAVRRAGGGAQVPPARRVRLHARLRHAARRRRPGPRARGRQRAAPAGARAGGRARDADGDGRRRPVRRRRGRLLPLRHAARLDGAALREDARRQRPARAALPGGVALRRRPRPRRPGALPACRRGRDRLPDRRRSGATTPTPSAAARTPTRSTTCWTRAGGRSCPRPSSTRRSTSTGTRWRRGRCSGGRRSWTARSSPTAPSACSTASAGAHAAATPWRTSCTPDGETGDGAPLLGDQVAVAAAALDAYEVTADRRWLRRARTLALWAVRQPAPAGRPPARPAGRARREPRPARPPHAGARGERGRGRGAAAPRGVHRRGAPARARAGDPRRLGAAPRAVRRPGGGRTRRRCCATWSGPTRSSWSAAATTPRRGGCTPPRSPPPHRCAPSSGWTPPTRPTRSG